MSIIGFSQRAAVELRRTSSVSSLDSGFIFIFLSKTSHQLNTNSSDFELLEHSITAAADPSAAIHHHDIRLKRLVRTGGLMRRYPDYFHIA